MLVIFLVLVAIAGVAAWRVLSHPMFGRLPSGERLERIRTSANYRNGSFENLVPKPHMVEGVSMPRLAWDFLFRKKERSRPSLPVPSIKTDLGALPADEDLALWLGHSSLYLQLAGKRLLVDPNFTSHASPFTWRTYSFAGTDLYAPEEIPYIDFLVITHDHFDHLNHDTIIALKDRIGIVVCGLGVGEHLEYWGLDPEKIVELDWEESAVIDGLAFICQPTHHFSGRTLWNRNPTLWAAFIVETAATKIYLGGDSGAGAHFAETGRRHGPFDIAFLENGQYDANWKYNHMRPEETFQAAADLGTKAFVPIHAGRFVLANHPWDEPYILLDAAADADGPQMLTPKMGEPFRLRHETPRFTRWWEEIE